MSNYRLKKAIKDAETKKRLERINSPEFQEMKKYKSSLEVFREDAQEMKEKIIPTEK